MKIDRPHIGVVPLRDIPLEILVQKLKWCLSGFCLLITGMLPMGAVAQITEPLLPLLPGPAPPSAPEAPAATPSLSAAGQTVTGRSRPEFNPLGLHLGEFFWYPRAELDEGYNSNIFATTTSPTSDLITAFSPSFDLVSIFPRSSFDLSGSATFQDFAAHPSQNTQTGTVSASGGLGITSGSSLYANAQVLHPYISYGSPNSPSDIAEPVTYWNYLARVGYMQGGRRISYGVDFGVAAAQYNAAPLVGGGVSPQSSQNSLISDAALHASYEIMPDYLGYIRIDGSRTSYLRAVSANSTIYRIDFGLQILPRHVIFGNVYAGYLIQNYTQSSPGSTPFPDYGGELVWTVTTLTTLTFDGLRTFYTGTPSSGTTITTGPAGNGYLVSSVGVRADHELLRNLLLTFNATYENDNFQGITRTDNVFGAGAGVTYLINRYLFLGGSFNYYQRSSTFAGASFNQDVVMLRVGTQF
ncbi:MAG: outer membrane beta-barrel protein [Acidobacteria bacterium]|nr:outer membrane beta-barrel protein [Acidobacteriota bacterium]